jgi:hypothetical protein
VDSIAPLPDSEDVYHGEEVLGKLFEAGCQPSHILHFAEEPLNDIAHPIEVFIMRDWFSGV